MDVQFDNKKMWESLIRKLEEESNPFCSYIHRALKDCGFEYNNDGKIVSIEPEPFIKEGNWYVCIQNLCPPQTSNQYNFVKGEIYVACNDSEIKDKQGNLAVFICGFPISEYFRPATECEILKAKFDSPELPEIVKEKVREITEKPTVSWDSVNGTLTFYNLTKEQEEKLKSALIGEPKQDASEELTEFVSALRDHISVNNGEWIDDVEEDAKDIGKRLMELARKQMTSEIDVNSMVNNIRELIKENSDGVVAHLTVCGAYRMGIEDTLKKIKGR